jgi:hypothetical protein
MNDPPRQGDFRSLQYILVPESVKLLNCLPGSELDEKFYQFVESHNVRALNPSATVDLQESIDLIYQRISGRCGVRINTYQIVKRGGEHGEVKVKVEFDNWEDAKRAHPVLINK